jgi:hypothetical protein
MNTGRGLTSGCCLFINASGEVEHSMQADEILLYMGLSGIPSTRTVDKGKSTVLWICVPRLRSRSHALQCSTLSVTIVKYTLANVSQYRQKRAQMRIIIFLGLFVGLGVDIS